MSYQAQYQSRTQSPRLPWPAEGHGLWIRDCCLYLVSTGQPQPPRLRFIVLFTFSFDLFLLKTTFLNLQSQTSLALEFDEDIVLAHVKRSKRSGYG